jgi:hypothetical protein
MARRNAGRRSIAWRALPGLLDGVVQDDAVVVVGDLGLVPELDGLAEPALGDRPGVRVVQAHPPGGPVRHRAGQPLSRLRGDLAGGFQQLRQIIDCCAAQPAPQPARGVLEPCRGQGRRLRVGAAQRPPCVGQRPRRLGGGALGQAREFPGRPNDRGVLSSRACAARELSFAAMACARLRGHPPARRAAAQDPTRDGASGEPIG